MGYEGRNIDQTQTKQMEREIRKTSDFLKNIIHNSPNAIMAADMKRTINLWNQAAEEILAIKPMMSWASSISYKYILKVWPRR